MFFCLKKKLRMKPCQALPGQFFGEIWFWSQNQIHIYIYSVVVSLIHKMPSSLDLRRILDWISHFYPGKLRWNPNMDVWKMISFSIGWFVGSMFIFQGAYNPSQKWSTWWGQWSSQHWGRWCRRQFFFWRGKAPSPIPSMYWYIYLHLPKYTMKWILWDMGASQKLQTKIHGLPASY